MRLGLLKEIKSMIRFFESMHEGVKSRDESKIYPAYIFMSILARHMNTGELTSTSIELYQQLMHDDYIRKFKEQ